MLAMLAAPNRATFSPVSRTFCNAVLRLSLVRLVNRLSPVVHPSVIRVVLAPPMLAIHVKSMPVVRATPMLVIRVKSMPVVLVEVSNSVASVCSIVATFVDRLLVVRATRAILVPPTLAIHVDRLLAVPVVAAIAVALDRLPRSCSSPAVEPKSSSRTSSVPWIAVMIAEPADRRFAVPVIRVEMNVGPKLAVPFHLLAVAANK
jgi:hypothetical protein